MTKPFASQKYNLLTEGSAVWTCFFFLLSAWQQDESLIVSSKKNLFLIQFLSTLTLLQIKSSCAETKDKDQDVGAEQQKKKHRREGKPKNTRGARWKVKNGDG